MPELHPIYDRLLFRFCLEMALDYRAVKQMIHGGRPLPEAIGDLLSRQLDLPHSVWAVTPSPPLVSPSGKRYSAAHMTPAEKREILRENGRIRRKLHSPVHDVLDLLRWTIDDFTKHLNAELGDKGPISRASVQFWVTGTRQVGEKGKSHAHAVQAPEFVREAAERLTAREAMKRQLGESAFLNRNAWPNVEPET